MNNKHLAEILLVEDNEGDIELTKEAFKKAKLRNNLNIAEDGDKALDYLYKRNGYEGVVTPHIILLDLNLPKTDGHEVLSIIKSDKNLMHIPIIVLTSSESDSDILSSYNLHANCYIVKPVDAVKFITIIQNVKDFWIDIVNFPSNDSH